MGTFLTRALRAVAATSALAFLGLAGAGAASAAAGPAARPCPVRPVIAYVVNGGSDTVTPIRTATGKPGMPIRVGASPEAIAITPNGRTVYVVNFDTKGSARGSVVPIRTATNKAGRAILLGINPGAIAITP
jgi:YVTN family beta-propeller protein